MASSDSDSSGVSALADELLSVALRSTDSSEYFWPSNVFMRILTEEKILIVLKDSRVKGLRKPELAEVVHRELPKIFAILVLNDNIKRLRDFTKYGVKDKDLPLPEEIPEGSHREESTRFNFLHRWRRIDRHRFNRTQWQFLTPYFGYDGMSTHTVLDEHMILPWTQIHDTASGAFASVQRVSMDPDSFDFGFPKRKAGINEFALKSLHSRDKVDFEREVRALKMLANPTEEHLIQLLCTFEYKDRYYMLFPWAQANLRNYWSSHPVAFSEKDGDVSGLRWISKQLWGLAGALYTIHEGAMAGSKGGFVGRHGDIKPENILWFTSVDDSQGALALSDFGLTRIHQEGTDLRKSRTRTLGFTVEYRPPEIELREHVMSRSADVWSLGCVFLEMVCWIHGGLDEVRRFSEERFNDAVGIKEGFFSFQLSNTKEPQFFVKASVTKAWAPAHYVSEKFMNDLRTHPRCTLFVQELLDLIQFRMLIVAPEDRITAKNLESTLYIIHERVANALDTRYFVQGLGSTAEQRTNPNPQPGLAVPSNAVHTKLQKYIENNQEEWNENSFRETLRLKSKRLKETKSIQMPPASTSVPLILVETMSEPEGATDAMSTHIEEIVATSWAQITNFGQERTATFVMLWELEECIRQELSGSQDLSPVLTITGDCKGNSWATSCQEYVKDTWGELGERLISSLKESLNVPSSGSTSFFSFNREESSDSSWCPIEISCKGTRHEICVAAQFLCWIAATFRLPKADELTCSSAKFSHSQGERVGDEVLTFTIGLHDLLPLEDGQGTCWKPLFPSTVMALGKVNTCPGTQGLRIPFDAMLEMAGILYDVALEDEEGKGAGTYFNGISYSLYPTAYIEDKSTIQWHLVSKKGWPDEDDAVAPDSYGGPKWERISNLKTLATSTAVLGYCGDVQIQLGTAARAEKLLNPEESSSVTEQPTWTMKGMSVTLGPKMPGVTANVGANFELRRSLQASMESNKMSDYKGILDRAKDGVVILCDTKRGEERAWMVSELSVILELFNTWATKRGWKDIQFARLGSDSGDEARKVLVGDPSKQYDYSKRLAIRAVATDETDKNIADIIRHIYVLIKKIRIATRDFAEDSRGALTLRRTSFTGWDWLDLTDLDAEIIYRKELIPRPPPHVGRNTREMRKTTDTKSSIDASSWTAFTQRVPVFFGHNLGDIIVPMTDGLCRQWNPMPVGLADLYLIASMHCVKALRAKQDKLPHQWAIFDESGPIWKLRGTDPFRPCVSCLAGNEKCSKQPQILSEAKRPVNTIFKENPKLRDQTNTRNGQPHGLNQSAQPTQPAPTALTSQPVQITNLQIASGGAVVFGREAKRVENKPLGLKKQINKLLPWK